MRKLASASIAAAAFTIALDASAATAYRLVQVGPLPVGNGVGIIFAKDMNQRGELVGVKTRADNTFELFVWQKGKSRVLGASRSGEISAAINEQGDVAGLLFNPASGVDEPVLIRGRRITPLGSPSELTFVPVEITDDGEVLGYTRDETLRTRAYVRDASGNFRELVGLPDSSTTVPLDFNNHGIAVGFSQSEQGQYYVLDCVRWRGSELEVLNPQDRERHCFAYDVNEHGAVAGEGTFFDGRTRGFTWSQGNFTALPFIHPADDLGNSASGLNDFGAVVGTNFNNEGVATAALWKDGVAIDLNAAIAPTDPLKSFVSLYQGIIIKNDGTILANGIDSRVGVTVPYLLIPLPN